MERHPKILLVDDLRANRYALRTLLCELDCEFIEAATGAEALLACTENDFALIIMDIQMPRMSGMEAAGVLAAHPQWRHMPIIFLTSHQDDAAQMMRGYEVGAVDYIQKPASEEILRAKAKNFLELWRNRQQLKVLLDTLTVRNLQLEAEIAERRRMETVIQRLAHFDALTQLPNRLLFSDRAHNALQRAERSKHHLAMLFLDLDHFKAVNDAHGHAAGDSLLKQVASRLSSALRKSDTAARLAGDEFAVILEGDKVTASSARWVAEKICTSLYQPYTLLLGGGQSITANISVSIGVALFPNHGADFDALLSAADEAMYMAKRSGKNRVACVGDNS